MEVKIFDAVVFRIGGDEFVIITDTSEEGPAFDVIQATKISWMTLFSEMILTSE